MAEARDETVVLTKSVPFGTKINVTVIDVLGPTWPSGLRRGDLWGKNEWGASAHTILVLSGETGEIYYLVCQCVERMTRPIGEKSTITFQQGGIRGSYWCYDVPTSNKPSSIPPEPDSPEPSPDVPGLW